MPPHQVFCSACGSPYEVDPTPGPFYLHCDDCLAITLGLGPNWMPKDGVAPEEITLPASLTFQEKEPDFTSRGTLLSVEMALRLPHSTSALPATLTEAELSFLYGQIAVA